MEYKKKKQQKSDDPDLMIMALKEEKRKLAEYEIIENHEMIERKHKLKGTLAALNWKKQTCLTFLITLKEDAISYESDWNILIEDASAKNTELSRKFVDMELHHMPSVKEESYEETPRTAAFKQ